MAHVRIQTLLPAPGRLRGEPKGVDFGKGAALKEHQLRGPIP